MKTIRSYISSDGSVKHLLIEEVGHSGYLKLIQDSVEKIEQALNQTSNGDEIQALRELKESYRRTLMGEQSPRSWTPDPNVKYLSHCVMVAFCPIMSAQKNERNYRSEVTRYKDYWRKNLPIRKYLGAIKLAPEKFESVSDGVDASINWVYA